MKIQEPHPGEIPFKSFLAMATEFSSSVLKNLVLPSVWPHLTSAHAEKVPPVCFLKLKKSEHFLIYMVPVIPFLFRKGNAFLLGTIEANPFRVVDCCLLSVPEKKVPALSPGRLLYTGFSRKCRIVPHTVSACFRLPAMIAMVNILQFSIFADAKTAFSS